MAKAGNSSGRIRCAATYSLHPKAHNLAAFADVVLSRRGPMMAKQGKVGTPAWRCRRRGWQGRGDIDAAWQRTRARWQSGQPSHARAAARRQRQQCCAGVAREHAWQVATPARRAAASGRAHVDATTGRGAGLPAQCMCVSVVCRAATVARAAAQDLAARPTSARQGASRRLGRGMAAATMLAARQRVVVGGQGPQSKGHVRAHTPRRSSGSAPGAVVRAGKPAAVPGQAGGGDRAQKWTM